MDKIYIPTLGRHVNQITWNNFPKFLQDISIFVVQPQETKYFLDKPHIVLPDNNIGMSNTRKWIWEHGYNQIFGVFDDDLAFIKRLPKGNKPSKIPMTEEDWEMVINEIDKCLDTDYGFAGFRRGTLPPASNNKDYNINAETLQAVFYNGKILPTAKELDWQPNYYAEDVMLHLQLVLKGHKNKVFNNLGMISKQFTEGGCQADQSISKNGRTPSDIDKSHQLMVDTYSPFAKYKMKNGKVVRNKDGSRKIDILYKKAYKQRESFLTRLI